MNGSYNINKEKRRRRQEMRVQRVVNPLAGGEVEGDSVHLKSSPDSEAPSGRAQLTICLGLTDESAILNQKNH